MPKMIIMLNVAILNIHKFYHCIVLICKVAVLSHLSVVYSGMRFFVSKLC